MALPRNPAEKAFGHSADLMGYAALSDANRAWLAASAVSERKAKRRSLRNGLAVAACSGLLVVMAAPSTVNAATFTWANSNVNGATPAASLNWFNATQGTWTGGTPVTTNNTTVIKFFQDATTALTNTGASGNTQASVIDNGGTAVQLGTLTLSGKASATTGANLTMNISGDALNFSAATGTINLDGVNNTRTLTYNVNSAIQLGTASSAIALTITGAGTGTFKIGGAISELQSGGGSSILKSGSSAVVITGLVDISGGISASGGIITLGNTSNSLFGGITLSGGAQLNMDTTSVTTDARMYGGNSIAVTSGNSTVRGFINSSGFTTMTGGINISGGATLTTSIASAVWSFNSSGVLQGSGTLSGAGSSTSGVTINLLNTGNTFTGTLQNPSVKGFNVASLGDGGKISLQQNSAGNNIFSLNSTTAAPIVFNTRVIELAVAAAGEIQNNASSASNTLTINTNLAFSGAGTRGLTLSGSNTGANAFNGDITNNGGSAVSVTKAGGGTWALSGTNTYSGPTTLGVANPPGPLTIQGIQALSSSTSIVLVDSSSSQTLLRILDDGAGTISRTTVPVSFTPSQTSAAGVTNFFVGNNSTTNGGTSASTQTNSIIALGGLTMGAAQAGNTGATINVTGANGYKLRFASIAYPDLSGKNAASNYTVKLNPTTGGLIVAGNVTPFASTNTNATPVLNLDGTNTGNEIQGNILNPTNVPTSNALSVTKTSTSTWTLTGTGSNYTGTTTVTGGTLIGTSATQSFGTNLSGISVGGSGTLSLRNDSSVSFTNGTSAYNIANSASGATINVDRITGTGSNTITVGNLTTTSTAATWQLNVTGANGVSLSAGTLTTPTSASTVSHTISNANVGGGMLTLAGVTGGGTGATSLLVFTGAGTTEVTGAITQAATAQSLTKSGNGTLILSGSSGYTGATVVTAGTLSIDSIGDVGAGNSAVGNPLLASSIIRLGNDTNTGTLIFTGGATSTDRQIQININANTATGSGVIRNNGSGTLTFSNATFNAAYVNASTVTRSVTLGGSNNGVIQGTIQNNSATNRIAVIKEDAGTWTLGGSSNYTGATTINGGKLLVNGSTASGSAVTVNSTGTLGGNGTVNGAVTVATGGTLRAGDGSAAADDLALNGNLTLNDGSFIELVLGDSGAHSTLTRTGGGTWAFDADQAFTVIPGGYPIPNTQVYDNVITGLTGSEAGLASIGTWSIVTSLWAGTFSFDGANVDLNVTATPEPTSLTLLGLGGMGLLKRRRRSSSTKAAV